MASNKSEYRARHAVARNRKKARKRSLYAGQWHGDPASEEQWKVLRKIGRKTGKRFPDGITKGAASAAITAHHASGGSPVALLPIHDREAT